MIETRLRVYHLDKEKRKVTETLKTIKIIQRQSTMLFFYMQDEVCNLNLIDYKVIYHNHYERFCRFGLGLVLLRLLDLDLFLFVFRSFSLSSFFVFAVIDVLLPFRI